MHVALGELALETDRDYRLAQGHFGYALELAEQALPAGFQGVLPPQRAANRPLYGAIDGLIECCRAGGQPRDVADLTAYARRLSGQGPAR